MIGIMIKREWLRFKPSILPVILFSIFFTLAIYIVIGFPFYSVLDKINGMKFMYWISPGIWIFMASLMSFLISQDGINSLLNEKRQIEAFSNSPISNKQIILGIFSWSIILGFFQWITSFLLTSLLNNDFISTSQFIIIMFQTFPVIIFFSGLAILSGLLIENKFTQITFTGIYFIILAFGTGCFIPIDLFPEEIFSIIKLIPVTNLVLGAQAISIQNSGSFTGGLFTLISGILFLLISFGVSNKRFRK
jgi:hypothetical protein